VYQGVKRAAGMAAAGLLLAGGIVAGDRATARAGADTKTVKQEVAQAAQIMARAMQKRDAATLEKQLAPGFRFRAAGGQTANRAEFANGIRRLLQNPNLKRVEYAVKRVTPQNNNQAQTIGAGRLTLLTRGSDNKTHLLVEEQTGRSFWTRTPTGWKRAAAQTLTTTYTLDGKPYRRTD